MSRKKHRKVALAKPNRNTSKDQSLQILELKRLIVKMAGTNLGVPLVDTDLNEIDIGTKDSYTPDEVRELVRFAQFDAELAFSDHSSA